MHQRTAIKRKQDDIPFKPPAYIVKTMISGGSLLKEYIEERAVEIANYIIDYNATVRQTAKKFGISKSTVHRDVAKWTGFLLKLRFSIWKEQSCLNPNAFLLHRKYGLCNKKRFAMDAHSALRKYGRHETLSRQTLY